MRFYCRSARLYYMGSVDGRVEKKRAFTYRTLPAFLCGFIPFDAGFKAVCKVFDLPLESKSPMHTTVLKLFVKVFNGLHI